MSQLEQGTRPRTRTNQQHILLLLKPIKLQWVDPFL